MESESNGVTTQNGNVKTEGIRQYYVGKIEELQVGVAISVRSYQLIYDSKHILFPSFSLACGNKKDSKSEASRSSKK